MRTTAMSDLTETDEAPSERYTSRAEDFKRHQSELASNWEREAARIGRQIDDRNNQRNVAIEALKHWQMVVSRLDREIEALSAARDIVTGAHTQEVPELVDDAFSRHR
jgi:chromosome segregation ATPase